MQSMTAPDPNSHESIKDKLSPGTLKDIEGLDPTVMGFMREECCGGVPPKMPGSMQLKEHVFLGTSMASTEWDKRTENVPGYNDLQAQVRGARPDATFTVFHAGSDADTTVLRFLLDDKTGTVSATQYNTSATDVVPWQARGVLSVDRSDEYFLFVCAHRNRDERCGYCGAVLVDLLQQAVKRHLGGKEGMPKVNVASCSHVGGHIYAGNVIVYSRHGGVCFGLFMPTDVDTLVSHIASGQPTIPPALVSHVRGQMGYRQSDRWCSLM